MAGSICENIRSKASSSSITIPTGSGSGRLSAVSVLACNALLRTGSLRGGSVFSQPGMAERNLTLDWWPVGSGPFMLSENNPNSRMVLSRNPNYRQDSLPVRGRTWRRGGRAARRLRQGASATRQGGVYARTGEHPILEQIPAGLLRCFRRLLRQFRPGGADGRTERREHQRRDARARHQPDDLGCADGDVHGLQHARSGCRRRR